MRIKSIQLTWFRGAADPVSLEPNCKSMVVYGGNGSGKSSFVDAVDYAINDGRIGHLAHEHSGNRQEYAVLNTHRPEGRHAELRIKFKDDSESKIEIDQLGSRSKSGAGPIHTWDYHRTVLRQDEVAAFIHDTKGDKYSALLPLFGLQHLEVAAENLRQLAKAVDLQPQGKGKLKSVQTKRREAFGAAGDDQIVAKIEELHAEYCPDSDGPKEALSTCIELKTALESRVRGSTEELRRYLILERAAALSLTTHVNAVRTISEKLADTTEQLMAERLEVLGSTRVFANKLGNDEATECPACGRSIPVSDFQAHVKAESMRLDAMLTTFKEWKSAIETLRDTLNSLKSNLRNDDVKAWLDKLAEGPLAGNLVYLDEINTNEPRGHWDEIELKELETTLLPLIDAAASVTEIPPPGAQKLQSHEQLVEAGYDVISTTKLAADAAHAERLVSFISSLEENVRKEIKLRSKGVVATISSELKAMWTILHPDKAIEGVHIYLPEHADKAIDIGLKFHGVEQASPRLTLSEGYRNSLGLCLFLAIARQETETDRPLFLDDVVVSLDRNHRGMIADLLEQKFSTRQVVLLTHDRDWYTDLRQQLDNKSWEFKTLLPYGTPDVGIRWSHKSTTFGDARAHLGDRPDMAGNEARKIMDVELAVIAERLRIRLPYLRGDKNDKRMAHELLERLVVDGKNCFDKKDEKAYEPHKDAIAALEAAKPLLTIWGNRGSHGFDVVRPEAAKLIDACEKALGVFTCSSCSKRIWFSDSANTKSVQCNCGQIRWRYGKG